MPPKRGYPFKHEWLLEFGLQITSRDPSTSSISNVKCRFCEGGRDVAEDEQNRKRKRTTRVQYYSGPSFRKENIRRHCEQQHATRFKNTRT